MDVVVSQRFSDDGERNTWCGICQKTDFYLQIRKDQNIEDLNTKYEAEQDDVKKEDINRAIELFEDILVPYQDRRRGRFEGPRMLH